MKIQLDNGGFIHIPFSTDDITFGEFCDFKAKEAEFIEQIKAEENTAPLLIEAIEIICRGNIGGLPYSITGDSVIQLVENEFFFSIEDDISVVRIYAHVITLLNRFDPSVITKEKDLIIRHEGIVYLVNSERACRLMTATNLMVCEVFEVLEFQRRFLVAKETATPNDVANLDFELGLYEIAILMRQEGETPPFKKAEFDEWIEKRVRVFEKIPLTDVLRVRFFLLNCLIGYTKTESFSISGRENRTFTPKIPKVIMKKR